MASGTRRDLCSPRCRYGKSWDRSRAWPRRPTTRSRSGFVPRGPERAELVLLTERLLPREDHGNLYVASAFGIFAATLERAARHFGHEVTVEPVGAAGPRQPRGPRAAQSCSGEARITGRRPPAPQADALDARRTSRLPYHDRAVDPDALARLRRVAADERPPLHPPRRPRCGRAALAPQRRGDHRQPEARRRARGDPPLDAAWADAGLRGRPVAGADEPARLGALVGVRGPVAVSPARDAQLRDEALPGDPAGDAPRRPALRRRSRAGPSCTPPAGCCRRCGWRWRAQTSTCSRWARC